MKLEKLKYRQPHDLAVLKALKRTIKDRVFIGELDIEDIHRNTNENLLSSCYASRDGHPGEGVFLNYGYWQSDIGFQTHGGLSELLWLCRVIDIIGEGNIPKGLKDRFKDTFKSLVFQTQLNQFSDKHISLFDANFSIIKKICKLREIGLTDNHINVLDEIVHLGTKELPF